MQRIATMIGLRPDQVALYRRLHAAVWPTVLAKISDCNIANYSIFLRLPESLLVGYYEYHGVDHAADMAKMAADPETQAWWSLCMPCQQPLATRAAGEWWSAMEEVFHHD